MKTILGVDGKLDYLPALQLYRNLDFKRAETVLVHAASSTVPFVPMGYPASLEAQLMYARQAESLGRSALENAKTAACASDVRCRTKLVSGDPAGALIEEAEESNADLVAVCATHTGRWTASFLGSVSRSLAIGCKSSILIAKQPMEAPRKLKVVFATDHSDASQKWAEHFFAMEAQGISEAHIVFALEISDWESQVLNVGIPEFAGSLNEWLLEKAREKNQALVDRFREVGINADAKVVNGHANDAIREAMQDTGADLLVMGAQGHGFMDRVLIGSVALHQVMSEPYPVMVVR